MARAGRYLQKELEAVGVEAEISGRAKHFYSIYVKMTRKGREFNEIYDLTAMRVIVDSVKDCYGTIGVIHSLWKPLPGRFKDWVAMPKSNMYQALHTTVIGPEGDRSRSRSARARCTTRPSTAWPRTGSTRTATATAPSRTRSSGSSTCSTGRRSWPTRRSSSRA